MTPAELQIACDIVEVGRRLWVREFVASNDGNISVRLDDRRIMTTPANVSKGFMTPDMMVITDLEGKKLAGERKASSGTGGRILRAQGRVPLGRFLERFECGLQLTGGRCELLLIRLWIGARLIEVVVRLDEICFSG